MKPKAVALAILMVATLCAIPAAAQITPGRLTGLVTDAQSAVLPGVTVIATSPALIGSQTTVTQADGRYLFPALPTGTYTLTFELSGFQKLTRENIQVSTGQTISVDARCGRLAGGERHRLAASPVVDVTTTKVGTT